MDSSRRWPSSAAFRRFRQLRPASFDLGQTWADVSQARAEIKQLWPISAKCWATSAKLWPTLVNFRRPRPNLADSGPLWPMLAKLGPNSNNSGPVPVKVGRVQPSSVKTGPLSTPVAEGLFYCKGICTESCGLRVTLESFPSVCSWTGMAEGVA